MYYAMSYNITPHYYIISYNINSHRIVHDNIVLHRNIPYNILYRVASCHDTYATVKHYSCILLLCLEEMWSNLTHARTHYPAYRITV